MRGNTFLKIIGVKKAILELVQRKLTQKSTLLATRDLAIFGFEKVVFWTFSKLYRKCLGIVFGLKRPTFA